MQCAQRSICFFKKIKRLPYNLFLNVRILPAHNQCLPQICNASILLSIAPLKLKGSVERRQATSPRPSALVHGFSAKVGIQPHCLRIQDLPHCQAACQARQIICTMCTLPAYSFAPPPSFLVFIGLTLFEI